MAVAAVVGAIGAAVSFSGMQQQKKAAKRAAAAEREANKARQGQAAIENRARRAKLIRQAQMARATAENIQATQGATTSMATGALATADTQQAVNLADFSEQGRQGGLLAEANLSLGIARSKFQRGAGLMKLGTTILSNAQRIGGAFGQGGQQFGGIIQSGPMNTRFGDAGTTTGGGFSGAMTRRFGSAWQHSPF